MGGTEINDCIDKDDVQNILVAFSLLISAILYKDKKFSYISGKSEIILNYLSGKELKLDDYDFLDEKDEKK